ncbi:MAG TPA: 50S ribosomal protein L1 [Schlesneria sp.]|jgi:large subunit ribosomal protein L1
MAHVSKRVRFLREQLTEVGSLDVGAAVQLLKSLEDKLPTGVRKCRFDQSVMIAMRLGIDPRQADQIVRGSIVLPHGIGKAKRVIVFAQGDNVAVATAAGADVVGGKDLAEKIKGGWLDFDVAIASPDMMGVVGPLGKVLGPRGLMPSPRAGTVTSDIAGAVKEYKAGKVEFRCDSGGNVHAVVGRLSFGQAELTENVDAMVKYVRSIKPATSKGQYVRNVCLSATMTPGISIAG